MEMMGGMFGAAGSVAGAFIAADAQKYSANTNWAIALMNYYARERERTQARYEAQRVEHKQDLGMTDIEGTQTKFVPGEGWQTTAAPAKKALMGRQDAEQMARLGHDAALRRQQLDANAAMQATERDKANALMGEMRRSSTPSASEISNLLYNASTTGTNEAFRDTAQIGARQALRSGTNPDRVMSEIAKAQGKAQGSARAQALLQGMQIAPQMEAEDKKMKANLYNLFATRASAMPDISFSPQAIDSSATSQAMRGGAASGELAVKAAMMEGGRLPYIPPNYGMANAVGAIGAAGQGLMRNVQGSRNTFSEGGNSLWDVFSDRERNRGGYGSFAGAP
jgi:hypothetical protein